MIASILIAFREGLEASLIVGILLGYLRKSNNQERRRYVWIGVILAVIASIALALGIQAVGAKLEGQAEEIFEGTIMLIAVVLLTWMIFWMRYQSRMIKSQLEGEMQNVIQTRQNWGLLGLSFVSVFREGVETALFLSAAAFASDGASTLIGAVIGLTLAVGAGFLIYATTVRLDLRTYFNVTSVLLLFFAAGLLAHGIHEFQEAGLIPIFVEHLWDTNNLLDESSTFGEILKALMGYNGNPSLLEVISYWAYWVFALFGVRWLVERRVSSQPLTPVNA